MRGMDGSKGTQRPSRNFSALGAWPPGPASSHLRNLTRHQGRPPQVWGSCVLRRGHRAEEVGLLYS